MSPLVMDCWGPAQVTQFHLLQYRTQHVCHLFPQNIAWREMQRPGLQWQDDISIYVP